MGSGTLRKRPQPAWPPVLYNICFSALVPPVLGLPRGSDGKESTCIVVWSLGWRGHGNPPQYSCLENPHEQRSLAGYSPWGHKELDWAAKYSTAPVPGFCFYSKMNRRLCGNGVQLVSMKEFGREVLQGSGISEGRLQRPAIWQILIVLSAVVT